MITGEPNNPNIPEFLDELVVKPKDLTNPEKPEELEKALKTLLVDETLRAQLGDAGKEWADIHSWELVAKKLYQE